MRAAPVSDVTVALIKRAGSSDSQVSTATTDADGRYTFSNVAALGGGESYFVQFVNETDANRLFYWRTKLVAALSGVVDLGVFDFQRRANLPDRRCCIHPARNVLLVSARHQRRFVCLPFEMETTARRLPHRLRWAMCPALT